MADENTRKNSVLNYESPALTAELQAGYTDKQIMRIADDQRRKHSDYFDRQALNELSKRMWHRWRCCCAFLDQCIQLVEINWLYQVMLKTHLATLADILFHPETGQGNSEERLLGGELPHQIDAVAIGQGEVANKHVELLLFA